MQTVLPREFTIVFLITVYIPPQTNAKLALAKLHNHISDLQNSHPDSMFIKAEDFNHANLKSVLPNLY